MTHREAGPIAVHSSSCALVILHWPNASRGGAGTTPWSRKTLAAHEDHESSANVGQVTHHFTVKGIDSRVSIFWKLFIKGLHEPLQVFLAAILHMLLKVGRGRKVSVGGSEGGEGTSGKANKAKFTGPD